VSFSLSHHEFALSSQNPTGVGVHPSFFSFFERDLSDTTPFFFFLFPNWGQVRKRTKRPPRLSFPPSNLAGPVPFFLSKGAGFLLFSHSYPWGGAVARFTSSFFFSSAKNLSFFRCSAWKGGRFPHVRPPYVRTAWAFSPFWEVFTGILSFLAGTTIFSCPFCPPPFGGGNRNRVGSSLQPNIRPGRHGGKTLPFFEHPASVTPTWSFPQDEYDEDGFL